MKASLHVSQSQRALLLLLLTSKRVQSQALLVWGFNVILIINIEKGHRYPRPSRTGLRGLPAPQPLIATHLRNVEMVFAML